MGRQEDDRAGQAVWAVEEKAGQLERQTKPVAAVLAGRREGSPTGLVSCASRQAGDRMRTKVGKNAVKASRQDKKEEKECRTAVGWAGQAGSVSGFAGVEAGRQDMWGRGCRLGK